MYLTFFFCYEYIEFYVIIHARTMLGSCNMKAQRGR